jgi:hypothetical protein
VTEVILAKNVRVGGERKLASVSDEDRHKEKETMRKFIVVAAVMALGIGLSGLAPAQAGQEASTRIGVPAQIDQVHSAVLEIAAEKGLTVTKDWRFATAYCVALSSGSQATRVCFYQEKNRTDVRIHGESQAAVDALAAAVRDRF